MESVSHCPHFGNLGKNGLISSAMWWLVHCPSWVGCTLHLVQQARSGWGVQIYRCRKCNTQFTSRKATKLSHFDALVCVNWVDNSLQASLKGWAICFRLAHMRAVTSSTHLYPIGYKIVNCRRLSPSRSTTPTRLNLTASTVWSGLNSPHKTVITRLRIGHSRMTHSYLLSRESQPVCDHCKCHLTVKHMLLECPSTGTTVVRHKYFSSTTLKELFSNVDARCILDFTNESSFYRAI